MALVSMKKSKPFPGNAEQPILSSSEQDDYPYGLQVNLEDEELQKLGNLRMAPGQEIIMKGICRVVSVSQQPDDDSKRSASLQIVSLQLGPDEDVSTADRVYSLGEGSNEQ